MKENGQSVIGAKVREVTNSRVFTFGSLFSGIGGFDLALERAGMACRWQVEVEASCRRVLEHHWPIVRRFTDVREVRKRELKPVALICGGFPCQDLSVAGRRAGLAGERSGLWSEFRRILAVRCPQWVLIENVSGLLSSNAGRDMGTILAELGHLGYGWAYRVLDAQWFGVAQRRRRVFIVGCLGRADRAAQVLFEPEGSTGDTPASRETGQDVAFALAASVRGTGDGHGNGWNSNYVIPDTITASYAKNRGEQAGKNGRMLCNVIAGTLSARYHKGIDSDVSEPIVAFNWQAAGSERTWIHRAGDYAGAVGATRHDAVASASFVRRLTPMECERLQGFPDGWTEPAGADTPRYRALGNAVCVSVVEWIGRRIMSADARDA